ncbi:uncharacterized protein LOC111405810 isoform X2 [Olea europaea var. sylvestris]|uniref:uncharacterized protein LOC111405810 isoform X2 n=1 Tax=Olea europaea var. sylvestris TaxID=158386 RepID=UPI000C1CDAD1|nr:uncharacterized protein LOC111405810 isoform X2 [Olea europaea var. sylvestris]
MARLFSQTLIRAAAAPFFPTLSSHLSATGKPKLIHRHLFSLADSNSYIELSQVEAEASVVKKIEEAIHTIIIKRSRPDWLPFVPGASYWVPPRRHSYGVAEIVHQLSNPLTEEQLNSLITFQGWPSSAFYLSHGRSDAFKDHIF